MNQDQTMRRMREQLLQLHAALIGLRTELCRVSLSLQDEVNAIDPQAHSAAATATAALMQRLRT